MGMNQCLSICYQKDSMETIAACAPVYGSAALLPVIDDIFDSLKVEVRRIADEKHLVQY